MEPFQPVINPVNGSLFLSAMVALLPLLTIFLTLGVLRWKAHWAGLARPSVWPRSWRSSPSGCRSTWRCCRPPGRRVRPLPDHLDRAHGHLALRDHRGRGRFEDLRATFSLISDDPRIQAILIAFCFGGLLEALAGFGAPVAITGVMLMSIGFSAAARRRHRAAGQHRPRRVRRDRHPDHHRRHAHRHPLPPRSAPTSATRPRSSPCSSRCCWCFIVDGKRGVQEVWPIALVIGVSFAVAQWVSANCISVELTDVIASLVGLAAGVVFLRFWQPKGTEEAARAPGSSLHDRTRRTAGFARPPTSSTTGRSAGSPAPQVVMALFPYLLVIVIFSVAKLVPVGRQLRSRHRHQGRLARPARRHGAHDGAGKLDLDDLPLQWLSSPGTLLIISGILVALVYQVSAA